MREMAPAPANGAMEKAERKQAGKEKSGSDTYLLMPDPKPSPLFTYAQVNKSACFFWK